MRLSILLLVAEKLINHSILYNKLVLIYYGSAVVFVVVFHYFNPSVFQTIIAVVFFFPKALQGDIGKLQRKMDSLQETGTYITNKSEPEYATKVKQQLGELKTNWATAVKQSNEQKEKLVKALSDAEKLDQDMKRLVTWMKHARSGVEDDESTLQHADVTQERLDHYKVRKCVFLFFNAAAFPPCMCLFIIYSFVQYIYK